MSEEEGGDNGDTGGLFCQSCSPTTRKLGYYITFAIGFFIFIYGIISLLGSNIWFLIIGCFVVLLAPLWIKNCKSCLLDLKNPLRITSTIIFLVFLAATLILHIIFNSTFVTITMGICLSLAGIWYFLSYFENGQKACISCLKGCCSSEK